VADEDVKRVVALAAADPKFFAALREDVTDAVTAEKTKRLSGLHLTTPEAAQLSAALGQPPKDTPPDPKGAAQGPYPTITFDVVGFIERLHNLHDPKQAVNIIEMFPPWRVIMPPRP
jgi:hypothetical protein